MYDHGSPLTIAALLRKNPLAPRAWHGTLKRKRGPEVEVEHRRKAKLYERRRHLYFDHCILLRDKLVIKGIIRATEGSNLHRNNVARQIVARITGP